MLARAHGGLAKGNRIDFVATKGVLQLDSQEASVIPLFPPLSPEVGDSVVSEDSEVDSEEVTAMVAHSPTTTAMPIPAMEAEGKAKEEKVCYKLWQQTHQTLIPYRLKEHIQWWIRAKAPRPVLELLQQGVLPDWPEPVLNIYPCHMSILEEGKALVLMEEYM